MARPATRDSTRASSLRRAVFDAVEPTKETECKTEPAKKTESVNKDIEVEKKMELGTTRAYSGAWP
jgi:hypothetical protein